jgi:hypothetical protein
MTFRPTDEDIARMLGARGSREVPADLRDAIEAAVLGEQRRTRRARRSIGRPTLLLAAAVALGAVGGAASLIGSQLRSPQHAPAVVEPSVVTATASPRSISPSNEPTTTLFADWKPSTIGPSTRSAFGAVVSDLAAFGDGYIAVGTEYSDSTLTVSKAIAWTSDDGSAWRVVSNDQDLAGFSPTAVAANDAGIVLGGFYPSDNVSEAPAILFSTDGRAWTKVANLSATLVAALPDRFIAAASGEKAMIWSSSDGHEWAKVADLGQAWISRLRVVRAGDGLRVAAIGTQIDGFNAGTMWTASASKLDAWQRLDLEDGSYEWMRDVAASASDEGLLGLAMRGYCCRVHAWSSTDGLAWHSLGDPVGYGGIQPESIAPTPSGFFVSGIQHSDELNGKLRAWLVRGGEWLSVPTDKLGIGVSQIRSIAVEPRPDGSVVVMTTLDFAEGQPPVPMAWVVR